MARDFNQNRIANARLVVATIDTYGTTFAIQNPYMADGFTKVNVVPPQAPTDITKFLEGSSTITIYPIASNVGKLCDYALASFPNITTLYLFNSEMVTLDDDLSYLASLDSIYVPSDLLDTYKSTYSTLASKFKIIIDQYTVEIEYFSGTSTTLTTQEVDRQLGMLSDNQVSALEKLVISDDYTFESASDIAWNYDFSDYISLDNNIWYGENYKFDFSVLSIVGSGTTALTNIDIDNAIANVPLFKRTAITQVKISGYTDMSVALEYDYEDLPNIAYVWLDNARYGKIELENGIIQLTKITNTLGGGSLSTGVYYNQDTIVKLGLKLNSVSGNWNGIFGADASWASQIFIEQTVGNNINAMLMSYRARTGNFTLEIKKDIEIKSYASTVGTTDEGYVKVDGTTIYTYDHSTAPSPTDHNFPNSEFTFRSSNAVLDIYYLQIIDSSNNYLFNGVPAYNKNTNQYGIYDKVTQTLKIGANYTGLGVWNEIIYFYPISDLVSEYDANEEQTFYLDYNGTLPTISSDYQITWYSDINCTTAILPENMVSGTRYYAKVVMLVLTIQGSGVLTSAIVNQQVAKAGSGVIKVVVDDNFSSFNTNCLDNISTLVNCDTLQIPFAQLYSSKPLSSLSSTSGQIKKLIITYSGTLSGDYIENVRSIEELYVNNLTSIGIYAIWSCNKLENIYAKELTTITYPIGGNDTENLKRLYLPKLKTVSTTILNTVYSFNTKIFIGTDDCSVSNFNEVNRVNYGYFNASSLVHYITTMANVEGKNKLIGVIDGNNTYNNIGISGNKLSMNYQKLTGIDTETNIQLLTPSDNALYLASDTGNLWQYSSGSWTNLFSGYTPTWYSDEGCTTTISTSSITSDMTVYVKLTAI